MSEFETLEEVETFIRKQVYSFLRKTRLDHIPEEDAVCVGWVVFLTMRDRHDPDKIPLGPYVTKYFQKNLRTELQKERWISKSGLTSAWSVTEGFHKHEDVLARLTQDEEDLETVQQVVDSISLLSPTEREYVTLRYVEDKSWNDIRDLMGLNTYEIQQISKSARIKVAKALR